MHSNREATLLIAANFASQHAPLKTELAARARRGPGRCRSVVGRADDRFLVLDDEQRVAFVAQIVHDAHQPADVARMEADARLVHDEERVDERRAETGRQIDALHFAAAQRAGGAIEREITERRPRKGNAVACTISSRNISAVESLGGSARSA